MDYILTKRRYLRHVDDMIHMGIDHRCVMATFMINMLGKDIHTKKSTSRKKH